jgi:hypothetical protein
MSTPLRALLLCATLTIAASALGQPNIVNFDFGAVPVGCSSWGFTYEGAQLTCIYPVTQNFNQTPGFGWILGWPLPLNGSPRFGGVGVTAANSAFCPPSFDGMPFHQAAILQSLGSFAWQTVSGFTTGSYTLSFYLGGRCAYGPQSIVARIDGNVIGTWDVPLSMPFTLETTTFTVNSNGSHTLEFMGMNPGDTTAFISYVTITPTER